MRILTVILPACLAVLAACASDSFLQPAAMRRPPELARSEPVTITGIGGGNRGSYAVAGHSGSFRRSEQRLVFFDVLDNRSGTTAFTLDGPMISEGISADCSMRERNITLGVLNFTPKRMSYQCFFESGGLPFPARFELQEVNGGFAGQLNKYERRGEIALDRVVLQIRSVHDVQGTPIPMATPIGYLFYLDDIAVGAVEVNNPPRLFLASDDIAVRRAVIAGSLALALFRDPAESAL